MFMGLRCMHQVPETFPYRAPLLVTSLVVYRVDQKSSFRVVVSL